MKLLRPLLVLFYIGCSLYPPIELSRVIVQSGMYYYPQLKGMLWIEVAVIWFFYLLSIALILAVLYYRRLSENTSSSPH